MDREARILKARRKELGLSQTEVATQAGMQIQQYQKFEYGSRKLSNCSMILGLRMYILKKKICIPQVVTVN